MGSIPIADGVSVVAPQSFIVPPEVATTSRLHISGEFFISGTSLCYMSGAQLRKINSVAA